MGHMGQILTEAQIKWLTFCRQVQIISLNEDVCIWVQISFTFVLEDPIDNKSAVLHEMAWN